MLSEVQEESDGWMAEQGYEGARSVDFVSLPGEVGKTGGKLVDGRRFFLVNMNLYRYIVLEVMDKLFMRQYSIRKH